MVVRSCTPIAVAVAEWAVYSFMPAGDERPPSLGCVDALVMFAGAVFAGLATVASRETISSGHKDASFLVGLAVCCLSMLFAAFNLILARVLGVKFGMKPLDSAVATSLPASALLFVPALMVPHPVAWPGSPWLTDWQVFAKVWQLSPETVGLIAVSGIFAVGFNIVQFVLARALSATHIAFVGNFNKAATVVLSMTLGLERLPGGLWSDVMVLSLLGNMAMFTVFSISAATAQASQTAGLKKSKEREAEDLAFSDTDATTPCPSSRPSAASDVTSEPASAVDFVSETTAD